MNDLSINKCIKLLKENVKDEYAQTYLKGIEQAIDEAGTLGLASQLNYVLANSQKWKGIDAAEVKSFVRTWIKDATSKVTKN